MTDHCGPDRFGVGGGKPSLCKFSAILGVLKCAIPARSLIFPIAATVVLIALASFDFLWFHVAAEGFAIIVGFVMFAVAWNTHNHSPNPYFIFVANGFLWVSLIDVFHTAAYKGMDIIPGLTADEPTQLWIAARYFEAFLLLVAPLFVGRPVPKLLSLFVLGFLALVPVAAIFLDRFPAAFIEGSGLTPFKIGSEYAIVAILFCAAFLMWQRRRYFGENTLVVMTLAIGATMISELAFTFYVDVYGLSNLVGHIFKFWAFWLIYFAIVETMLAEPYSLLVRKNSELAQSGIELAESERQKHLILDTLPDLVWLKDKDGVYLACNPLFEKFFGASETQIVGKTDYDFVEKELADFFRMHDRYAMNAGQSVVNEERVEFASDGRIIDLETIKTPMTDDHGQILGVLGIGRDITKRKNAEKELERANQELVSLSTTDQLTGLLNRREFDRILENELNRSQRDSTSLVFIMFDIDHFKNLNDRYGHAEGDAALRQIGATLKDLCRRPGDYGFRIGGEEFGVVLAGAGLEGGVAFAERVRTSIHGLHIPNTGAASGDEVTISLGVALSQADEKLTLEQIFKTADERLYKAKSSGRNRTVSE